MGDATKSVDPETRSANPYDAEICANPVPFYRELRDVLPVVRCANQPARPQSSTGEEGVKVDL